MGIRTLRRRDRHHTAPTILGFMGRAQAWAHELLLQQTSMPSEQRQQAISNAAIGALCVAPLLRRGIIYFILFI